MSSRKPQKTDALAEAAAVAAELAEQVQRAATIDLATETLTGDLRDFVLDRLRHEQDKRPWHERSETEQQRTVYDVEQAVARVVRQAVELIAAEGRRTIKGTLSQIVVKDGIKGVLEISRTDQQRHAIMDSVGSTVLIVVADIDDFTGEQAPVEITPDQPDLNDGAPVF